MINNISFCGCAAPYTNKKGFDITPIEQNPTQDEINQAIEITRSGKKPLEGLNGGAYFWGEDLVVKKYKPESQACSYDPKRETEALDRLYTAGIKHKNVQAGKYAFTTPDGQTYLVSTKIKGANPNPTTNKFNNKNLSELIKTLGTLDTLIYDPGHCCTDNFPFSIAMHYDLTRGNINIDENSAGVFDFEYSNFEELSRKYEWMNGKNTEFYETLSDLSDIPGLVSNLRSFEYRTLLPYIKEMCMGSKQVQAQKQTLDPKKTQEAKEFFRNYLKQKSYYHYGQQKIIRENAKQIEQELSLADSRTPFEKIINREKIVKSLCDLNAKEDVHGDALLWCSDEVVKAEAMKIQIASFIYTQSHFDRSELTRINPDEIKAYLQNANEFFTQMTEKYPNSLYWQDTLGLMKSWNNLAGWLDFQHQTPEDSAPQWVKSNHELFMKKVTDKHVVTLDEIVCN